jgi:alkylresorcinol/alkylpyrone synthase
MNRLGFRSDMKRIPIFGLGCVAGAAGLGRVHDYLVGHPKDVAILLSVELCSLTLQRQDLSIPNLIASGLFGDGAAAVVAVGDLHPTSEQALVTVCESRSRFYPDTEGVMGWKIGSDGFKIVLEATVPALAEAHLADDLDAFLIPLGLTRSAITQWVCHTGGPKVIGAFQSALDLEDADLQLTRNSLATVGNLSSASVLFVLADTLETRTPEAGELGVLMAMGPGFCNEMVLLKW